MTARWPENEALRRERENRGWSYAEEAAALRALAVSLGEPEPAADANLAWRWEAGVQQPGRYYRRLLCRLYDKPPDSMGLDRVKRRRFLQHMAALAFPAQPLASLFDAEKLVLQRAGPVSLNPETLGAFEGLTKYYRELYQAAPAPQLVRPVTSHLQFGLDLIRTTGSAIGRRRLVTATAQTGLLAGRLISFDLRRPDSARRCYDVAADLAEAVGDNLLAAAISGHLAFIPGFAGRAADADAYLSRARQLAGSDLTNTMSAWLSSAAAEVFAMAGDPRSSLKALALAEAKLASPDDRDDPEWQDWFSPVQFDSFKGYALLKARQPCEAEMALQAALAGLHAPSAAKQRAVVLADLADTRVVMHEIDEACHHLGQAAALARSTGYFTASERVWAVRANLTPWNREAAVKDLDEVLSA